MSVPEPPSETGWRTWVLKADSDFLCIENNGAHVLRELFLDELNEQPAVRDDDIAHHGLVRMLATGADRRTARPRSAPPA